MMRPELLKKPAILSDAAKKRLAAAVQHVESQSGAEVVLAVRARSGSYGVAAFAPGILASVAMLSFMLFSEHVFLLWQIAVAPTLALFAVAGLAHLLNWDRALFGRERVRQAVARNARVLFYDLGVANTRERSGLLIYFSLVERNVEVLPDQGVRTRVAAADLARVARDMEDALRRLRGEALIDAVVTNIESLGPVLGRAIPRSATDQNELADVV